MNLIKVLADNVINKIAAGEVVERPAAVVKELVDNSIDAGASRIQVYIEDGGLKLVEVIDNGTGMSKVDAVNAFERHATSKLVDAKDLDCISTMGFRGEALSSIAAVSQLNLKTKRADSEVGTVVNYFGGTLKDVATIACATGSIISVRNLFFNLPARKKFLKSPATEQARIIQWYKQIALAHPGIQFELYADGRQIICLLPVNKVYARAEQIFGQAFKFLTRTEGEYQVEAFISHPGEAEQRKSALYLLANGRIIQDSILLRAIKEGYGTSLKDREYPQGFIHIKCKPSEIDINVHPQKAEVRFRNSQFVFNFVKETVAKILADNKQAIFDRNQKFSVPEEVSSAGYSYTEAVALPIKNTYNATLSQPNSSLSSNYALKVEHSNEVTQLYEKPIDQILETRSQIYNFERVNKALQPEAFAYTRLAYIGRLFACYLLFELDQKFYLIDMHAAHERVNFNKIRESLLKKEVIKQKLLVPEVVNLSESEVVNCVENIQAFAAIGFEIEEFSSQAIIVRSVPAQLHNLNIKAFIQEAAQAELSNWLKDLFNRELDHLAARLACHASVRSGDSLNISEVNELLKQLEIAESSAACPHGRPVITAFSERDVSKWFGRDK